MSKAAGERPLIPSSLSFLNDLFECNTPIIKHYIPPKFKEDFIDIGFPLMGSNFNIKEYEDYLYLSRLHNINDEKRIKNLRNYTYWEINKPLFKGNYRNISGRRWANVKFTGQITDDIAEYTSMF